MNRDILVGNWKIFTGILQDYACGGTGDIAGMIRGQRRVLAGKIQRSYGRSRLQAERAARRFQKGTSK